MGNCLRRDWATDIWTGFLRCEVGWPHEQTTRIWVRAEKEQHVRVWVANNNDRPVCLEFWERKYFQFLCRRSLIWSQSFSGFWWLPLGTWAEACKWMGESRRFINQGCLNERFGVHKSCSLFFAALKGKGFEIYHIKISWCNNQKSPQA